MAVIDTVTPSTYELVAVDTYRDIHKGIRADLFDLTGSAGRIDPSCPADVADLARHVDQTVDFLVVHAGHEDTHLVPVMSELLPDLNATDPARPRRARRPSGRPAGLGADRRRGAGG